LRSRDEQRFRIEVLGPGPAAHGAALERPPFRGGRASFSVLGQTMTETRRTSLYDRHVAAKARMVPFAGFEMPIQYTGIVDEHQAVRTGAGIFDVSHMGELEMSGEHAAAVVDYLCTN